MWSLIFGVNIPITSNFTPQWIHFKCNLPEATGGRLRVEPVIGVVIFSQLLDSAQDIAQGRAPEVLHNVYRWVITDDFFNVNMTSDLQEKQRGA
jgi:hypothetical protein